MDARCTKRVQADSVAPASPRLQRPTGTRVDGSELKIGKFCARQESDYTSPDAHVRTHAPACDSGWLLAGM